MNDMNRMAGRMVSVLLAAVLTLNSGCASEMGKGAPGKAATLTQSYVWYDGDQQRTVWLNPQVVAEFNPDSKSESPVRSAYPSATPVQTKQAQGAVRLWKFDTPAAGVIGSLKIAQPQGRYSAVFQDGPVSGSGMRALPGNIIVYLDPQWDAAKVGDWLAAHKLEVVQKLEIGPNIYVIRTGPGMEALDTANALYRSGEVKAAFPDWWQEVTAR